MNNINDLKEKIAQTTFLTEKEKKLLLNKLNRKKPDINGFLKALATILKLSKDLLDIFF